MWLHHLLNFLASAASIFFNAIGATFLGVLVDVAFAGSVAFIALHKKRRDEGWGAMLNHWRQEYKAGIRFALWSALILYGPVIVWSVGKAVYEDHQNLVAAITEEHHTISQLTSKQDVDARIATIATGDFNRVDGFLVLGLTFTNPDDSPRRLNQLALKAKFGDEVERAKEMLLPATDQFSFRLKKIKGGTISLKRGEDCGIILDDPIPAQATRTCWVMGILKERASSMLQGISLFDFYDVGTGKPREISRPMVGGDDLIHP